MPIHNWSQVDPGLFHDFHQAWTIELRNALNGGLLPDDYFALAEQSVGGPIPDVVTLARAVHRPPEQSGNVLALADAPPQVKHTAMAELDLYSQRANRIVLKHRLGEVVAVIEIVSPGNKSSTGALRTFVEKAENLLRNKVSLLVIDLLPPTRRDPQGIHKAIWDQLEEQPFELPADKPLTIAAYSAAELPTAYVEPVAVGDPLPSLPLFLTAQHYVPAPLDASYQTTWDKCPRILKELVAGS